MHPELIVIRQTFQPRRSLSIFAHFPSHFGWRSHMVPQAAVDANEIDFVMGISV